MNEDVSPIEHDDFPCLAMLVFKGVFSSACLRLFFFKAMPDGTDSPIWRALSAQVRRTKKNGQGGM